jgi:hypothetical protein
MTAGMAAFVWLFRRVVTLFAALDATERLEDNLPRRGRAGSVEHDK